MNGIQAAPALQTSFSWCLASRSRIYTALDDYNLGCLDMKLKKS